jgi:hypothetical protein
MRLDMVQTNIKFQQEASEQTMKETVGGYVHTPTTKANFMAKSMQKWPGCRRFVKAFGPGKITPEHYEYLMGY